MILVDTKYEFGLIDGELALIDEVHTPDSSRYWMLETYQPGQEPENYDKEFLRKWFVGQGYRGKALHRNMPDEFVAQQWPSATSTLIERLTGETFVPGEQPVAERIAQESGAVADLMDEMRTDHYGIAFRHEPCAKAVAETLKSFGIAV